MRSDFAFRQKAEIVGNCKNRQWSKEHPPSLPKDDRAVIGAEAPLEVNSLRKRSLGLWVTLCNLIHACLKKVSWYSVGLSLK